MRTAGGRAEPAVGPGVEPAMGAVRVVAQSAWPEWRRRRQGVRSWLEGEADPTSQRGGGHSRRKVQPACEVVGPGVRGATHAEVQEAERGGSVS